MDADDGHRTVRAVITGRVQGVAYRDWARTTALRLGLTGWVRNRADGSVEAVFSGRGGDVGDMLELCGLGPPAARVADVSVEEQAQPDLSGQFVIRPTM